MKIHNGLHWCYGKIAKSQTCTGAIALVRNQLEQVIRHHFSNTYYSCEQADARLLKALGPKIRRFVDVGANVGAFTAALLRHAPCDCAGLLLEPSSSAQSALGARFGGGKEPRVHIVAAAAGSQIGEAPFFEEDEAGETSTLLPLAVSGRGKWTTVQITTVDAEIRSKEWNWVDLIKIDAEGYDLQVIDGMSSVLARRAVGLVQFEYNSSWKASNSFLRDAFDRFEANGFDVFLLTARGLHRANYRRYGDYFAYSNYVAVNPEWKDSIRPIVGRPY